jgi:diguanylate cyclase (GGDEF)-like protein/PAS domain S-box-containing protein
MAAVDVAPSTSFGLPPGWDGVPPGAVRALLHGTTQTLLPLLVVSAPGRPVLEQATVVWANRATGQLLRYETRALVGRAMGRLVVPPRPGEHRPELLRRERTHSTALTMQVADGSHIDVLVRALPAASDPLWALSLRLPKAQDDEAVQAAVAAHERRFVTLVERSPVPTVLSEAGMRLSHVNDAFTTLMGTTAEDLLGVAWLDRVHPEDLGDVVTCVQQVLEGEEAETPARVVRPDGSTRWVRLRLSPELDLRHGAGFVGTAEDVTDRRAFERRLSHQARHDALTGLPNRTHLIEVMTERLRARDGSTSPMTCMFLDLDDFKVVNDSLGHDAGDRLLVEVSRRLQGVVRSTDVVARWGGDEFVVVCDGLPSDEAALSLAQQVMNRLQEGLSVDGVQLRVTASIGVARVAPEHDSPDQVLQDCDIAMYRAKRAGRNRVSLCDATARQDAHDALMLTQDLRQALAEDGLTVAYQPVVALDDPSALPAVEALVRWRHAVRGDVSPEVLVRTAEANGMIDVLGIHVLREACRQMAGWVRELGERAPQKVNVNLSAIQLASERLVDAVAAVLAETGLAGTRLCLEITESALMSDPAACRERLLRLKALGVQLAVDDFGTGYSSLAYLRQLPVDYLKVDRSFVSELSEGHSEVTSAVVGLARSLGLTAIAEGVEHPGQVQALRELGCSMAQGWLYARPMTAQELVDWLGTGPS